MTMELVIRFDYGSTDPLGPAATTARAAGPSPGPTRLVLRTPDR